ncbi:hypothetical protein [Hyphomicrobium sp. CS1BSMeth3]|uniref:hypothetical protein n=1 Tax=Hyphomicrobium sp. CS1BSMeth3 TaxID=1892844 RepID=UPI000931EB14|nr:hypothetical protein [Hyphomicrobium sp. CS1BSMeth3]
MLETGLVLGMTATHLGVPLTDLVAWGLVLAFLAAPVVPLDDIRRQRLIKTARQNSEIAGVKPLPAAAPRQLDEVGERKPVMPAARRLTATEQWQAVSRLVSVGAERAMAVARDQQAIRRELDSLDFTLENLRRELAAVMTLPVVQSAELVPMRVASRPRALAA